MRIQLLLYLVLQSAYTRLGTSSKYLCSLAVDRILSTIPKGLRKQTLSHFTWQEPPRAGSLYATPIWCPMNDAQLIHYTLLILSPGAGERFSGLMGRLNRF